MVGGSPGSRSVARAEAYAASAEFERDLSAVRHVWGSRGVIGTAGMGIFMSYSLVPILTAVRREHGLPRTATMRLGLESRRERQFLSGMVGLPSAGGTILGIGDRGIRQSVLDLGVAHWSYPGMTGEFMTYVASVIA